jgi:hypothetical protein
VYIDGFNFYYGAAKGTPHKWLDLEGDSYAVTKEPIHLQPPNP